MIRFTIIQSVAYSGARLIYRRHEYSFDTEPRPAECSTCITINEVELEYGNERRILCVSGYCPYQGWRETHLSPPAYSAAGLIVSTPEESTPGAAIGLNDTQNRWPAYVNESGWVCIGDPADPGDQAVEFAPESVAVLRGDALIALWLHPIMEGSD